MNKMLTIIGAVVLVVAIGGAWYYFSLLKNNQELPSSVRSESNDKIAAQTSDTPTGFQTVHAIPGLSFNVSESWTPGKLPESGYRGYFSPRYSFTAMRLRGAYIAYHRDRAPEEWVERPDEYFALMKSNGREWKETTLDGRPALIRSANNNGYQVIARFDDTFIDILYGDETGEYKAVFDEFLRSFKVE